jgi:hypothetical protein
MDQIDRYIADLHIFIGSSKVPILQEHEQAYRSFTGNARQRKGEPDIEVDLLLEAPPDDADWVKIFEDGQTWSVYRCQREYFLCFAPLRHGEDPIWVARFKRDCGHVIVYCDEKRICLEGKKSGIINPVRYPLDQHLIMYHLSQAGGALIHAAGWKVNGKGFIFPGRSGAGKSTLSRLFSCRERWLGLSDDRVLIRKREKDIHCYGTPWPGEGGYAMNEGSELSGIFFLCHAVENRIKALTIGEALKRLLPVVSIPWYDREICLNIIEFCRDCLSQIPVYELCFEPRTSMVDYFERFIQSELVLAS